MGAELVKIDDVPYRRNYRKFIIDDESDLANLPTTTKEGNLEDECANQPCAAGSTAVCCRAFFVYVLTPSDKWLHAFNDAWTAL